MFSKKRVTQSTPWRALPVWPHTTIPPRLPLCAFRDALFRVAGGEGSSRLGRVLSMLEGVSLISYVLVFLIASLPDFRERTAGVFGVSPLPSRILVWVEFFTAIFFLLLFSARLASVTAVPGRREALTFAHETLDSGSGGGGGGGGEALLEGGDGGGEDAGGPLSSEEEEEWEEANALIGKGVSLSGLQLAAVLRSGRLPGVVFHQGHDYEHGGLLRWVKRLGAFFSRPETLVDVFSWLPQVLDFALGNNPNLVLLRALGFARVLRLLRATAETVAFKILRRSLSRASSVLWVSFVPTMVVVVATFSCAIYICEKGTWGDGPEGPTWYRPDASGASAQPTPFRSVVHALWFVVVTLSTLGYGDLTPTSPSGKVVATLAISFGLLSIAVPAVRAPPPPPAPVEPAAPSHTAPHPLPPRLERKRTDGGGLALFQRVRRAPAKGEGARQAEAGALKSSVGGRRRARYAALGGARRARRGQR